MRITLPTFLILLAWTLLLCSGPTPEGDSARQSKFYVMSDGDDTNPATLKLPWETLSRVNQHSFTAGDTIFFARGSRFSGGLLITDSGADEKPIVLTTYGKGLAPSFTNPDLSVLNGNMIQIRGSHILVDGLHFHSGVAADQERGVNARQLVDAETEEHLWAETYDRDLTDIFAIQSDVARQIAKALKATLTPEEKSYIEQKPTDNLEAYDYYIQGNNFWYRQWLGYSGRHVMVNAVEMYEKAVKLDPNFALAWARLARVHLRSYAWWRTDPTPERLEQAQRSLDHALALDPAHPEVILAHGYYYYWTEDYRQALEYFQQALVKAPNNSEILGAVGIAYRRLGEYETALDFFKPALQSDPRHIERIEHLSLSYYYLRRWREAEHYADLMIQLEPEAWLGYNYKLYSIIGSSGDLQKMRQVLAQGARHGADLRVWEFRVDKYAGHYQEAVDRIQSYDDVTDWQLELAALYRLMGRPQQAAAYYDSARIYYENRVAVDAKDHFAHAYLGQSYAGLGRRDDALRQVDIATTLKSVEKDALRGTQTLIRVLPIYILLGDYDRAFDLLEQLLSIPSGMNLNWIRLDPDCKPLREHPRFKALVAGD